MVDPVTLQIYTGLHLWFLWAKFNFLGLRTSLGLHFNEIPGASRIFELKLFTSSETVSIWFLTAYHSRLHDILSIKGAKFVGGVTN